MSSKICNRCRRPHGNGSSYCDECKPVNSNKSSHAKKRVTQPVYGTARWKKVRAMKLKINPLCEYCAEGGVVTQAVMVDHIKEIADGGAAFDLNNLASTCMPCHGKKTAKVSKERERGY